MVLQFIFGPLNKVVSIEERILEFSLLFLSVFDELLLMVRAAVIYFLFGQFEFWKQLFDW